MTNSEKLKALRELEETLQKLDRGRLPPHQNFVDRTAAVFALCVAIIVYSIAVYLAEGEIVKISLLATIPAALASAFAMWIARIYANRKYKGARTFREAILKLISEYEATNERKISRIKIHGMVREWKTISSSNIRDWISEERHILKRTLQSTQFEGKQCKLTTKI